jgi:hypothetical protein
MGTAWTVIEWINWARQLLERQNVQSRQGMCTVYRGVRSGCQTYSRFVDARVGDLETQTFYSVSEGVMSRKMKQLRPYMSGKCLFSFVFED